MNVYSSPRVAQE